LTGGTQIKIAGPFFGGKVIADAMSTVQITVSNIRNPRSLETTGIFTFESFDSDDQLIDYYSESNTAVSMVQVAPFSSAALKLVSSYNVGQSDVLFTFELRMQTSLLSGDFFFFRLPIEIAVPQFPLTKCYSA